jgi:tRNA dimethylallyltransferase
MTKGYSPDLPALRAVGFPEMFAFLKGEINQTEAIRRIQQHTRNYAKRQLTWLRKEPNIIWFQPENFNKIPEFVQNQLLS